MGSKSDKQRWTIRPRKQTTSRIVKDVATGLMLVGLLMNIPAGYFVAFPGSNFVFTVGGAFFVVGFLIAVVNAALTDRIDLRLAAQAMLAIAILAFSVAFYWNVGRTVVIGAGILFSLASLLLFLIERNRGSR